MTTLGAVFRPQLPPERLRSVAEAADQAGLEELWLWEDCFREGGMASAAACLAWTERLRVGVGLFPVPLRNVALASMEMATLQRIFGDRFVPAVGHGVQEWMAQVGAGVGSPLTLLREYVTALRALLRGERVSMQGRYVLLDDVGLDWPPSAAPPVHVGAVGPRTMRLSGEIADGTLLVAAARIEQIRRARTLIDSARAKAGRDGHHRLVTFLHAATGADATERIRAEIEADGEEPIAQYAERVDADTVAEAVTAFAEAGADSVILQPTPDEQDPEGFVRFVTEEIRPRLP